MSLLFVHLYLDNEQVRPAHYHVIDGAASSSHLQDLDLSLEQAAGDDVGEYTNRSISSCLMER